jgi:hypothetical protein
MRNTNMGSHLPEIARLKFQADIPLVMQAQENTLKNAERRKANTKRAEKPRLIAFQVQGTVGGTQGMAIENLALKDVVLTTFGMLPGDVLVFPIMIEPDNKQIESVGLRNWFGTRDQLLKGMALGGIHLPSSSKTILKGSNGLCALPNIVFVEGCVDAQGKLRLRDHHDVARVLASWIFHFEHSNLGPAMLQVLFDRTKTLRSGFTHTEPAQCSFGIQAWRADGLEITKFQSMRMAAQYLKGFIAGNLTKVDDPLEGPAIRGAMEDMRKEILFELSLAFDQIHLSIATKLGVEPMEWLNKEQKAYKSATRLKYAQFQHLTAQYKKDYLQPCLVSMERKSTELVQQKICTLQKAINDRFDGGVYLDYLSAALQGVTDVGMKNQPPLIVGLETILNHEAETQRLRAEKLNQRATILLKEMQEHCDRASVHCQQNHGRAANDALSLASNKWADAQKIEMESRANQQIYYILTSLSAECHKAAIKLDADKERIARSLRELEGHCKATGLGISQSPVEKMTRRQLLDTEDLNELYKESTGHPWEVQLPDALREDVERKSGKPSTWRLLNQPELVQLIIDACRPFFESTILQKKKLTSAGIWEFLMWKSSHGLNIESFCKQTVDLSDALVSLNTAAGAGMPEARRDVLVGASDPSTLELFGHQAKRCFSIDDPALLIVVTLLSGIPFINLSRYPEGKEAYSRDPFVLLSSADLEEIQKNLDR